MDAQLANRVWREILPTCVSVSAGPPLEHAEPLTERERKSAGAVDALRMIELENGRAYLRRALANLGRYDTDVPISADGSPQWPNGVTGSLTHAMSDAGGQIAAVVARTRDVRAVGIDVEYEGGLPPRTWSHVLTGRELEYIRALPPDARAAEVQLVWCAKEAAAKAARRSFEPADLEIERDPAGDGFAALWRSGTGQPARAEEIWRGRTTRARGFILAAVVVPNRPSWAVRRPYG